MNRLIEIALTRLWPFAVLTLLALFVACGPAATPTTEPVIEQTAAPTAVPTEAAAAETPRQPVQPARSRTVAPPTRTPAEPTATTASRPTAGATGPSPTATLPAPTVEPRRPSPTERPQLPAVEVPPDHPAAVLALLPDSRMYSYINLETVSQRPDLQEHVEFQLAHFVSQGELPFAQELLVSIGAEALLLSSPVRTYGWAIVLLGDFTRLAEALRASAQSGGGLSVSVIDTYRDIDIYALVRTKSSGYQTEIYLTVLDPETLTASKDPDSVRDVIDRHKDGGQLPKGLPAMVEDWGLSDFLEVFPNEAFDDQGSPTDAGRVYAFHVELADESTTILRALQQFDDEEHAVAAAAWLNEQTEPRFRRIGWGSSVTIDGWRHSGSTVFGEATVPDEDVPDLLLGN